jgi:L-methionine (R)-S-oxide reductase
MTSIQDWLEVLLEAEGAVAGSVHLQRGRDLYLVAHRNLPPPVVAAVEHVPEGKGMAGQAQVLRVPVQTCNLQRDNSGNVRPGARAVQAQAAVALPVFAPDGSVRAVVGLAWGHEGNLEPQREQDLLAKVATLTTQGQ